PGSGRGYANEGSKRGGEYGGKRGKKASYGHEEMVDTGDWRQFFQGNNNKKLKGAEPDFSEEGWARRKPKK
ncbi:MAG: ATP-dependent RNA helicase, partial [Prevotella sp.]|nr:ATP-dependent RNA helicase [Prevotella sp.]